LQERVFARLFEAAEIAHFNREDRLGYEASLKTYRDLKNVVDTSFDEGRAEGKAEGLEEGLEKGEAIGLEKGRAEGEVRRSLEIALQMKKLGEPVEKIILLTGLEKDVIEKL
jgi:flagellar biosynthesis/type III secretory pathway protein FliH